MEKEFISLLYIDASRTGEDVSDFSKQNGFILQTCDGFAAAVDQVKRKQPDLILIASDTGNTQAIETGIKDLFETRVTFPPAVFLIVSDVPPSEKRVMLMQKGVDDFLISPFLSLEVKEKYTLYQQLKQCRQEIFAQDMKIKKSLGYLDKFKDELRSTKAALFEERTTLNNALKQVNQMTAERKRLKKEKKELKETLSGNLEGFGELLSTLIKTRIEKNRGHSDRVAHICQFIGRQLKFDEKKLEDLGKAAMLHEVGLLFIPEKTLQKTKDQLTDYEKDLFVQYPVKGADLLSDCTEFNTSGDIIRCLNENSDGSGSPMGLKRRYIPLLSRILAGADVFDTLKDEKEVSSLEIFLEKLEAFSGTRLDPSIVALLEKYAVLHMGSDSYRVKGVGIHQLEPGMKLGTALFTHTGTKLFSVNTLLTMDAIDKIKKYNREYPVDDTVYIRA